MLKEIKGAIFDLDGTLIDSMWIWEKIDVDYLGQLGLEMPEGLKDEINHLSFQETGMYFKNRFNIEDSLDTILDTWHRMALDHYSNDVCLKPNVIPFLDMLKSNNIKIGLATSNSYPLLEAVLKNTGIYDYFDAITTTDESGKNKSNPDVYLLAAKRLGIDPSKCIVFEDIIEAVRGAKLAKMKVIAVNDSSATYQKEQLIADSDKYIYDYSELLTN